MELQQSQRKFLRVHGKKTEKLLNTEGSICKAPGMSAGAMCVASDSGSRPHIVSKTKKGSLACDEACLAWKSKKFCSHVLAVAENSHCLSDFLSSYRKAKVVGSYTAASTHNQSKSVGVVQRERVLLSTKNLRLKNM